MLFDPWASASVESPEIVEELRPERWSAPGRTFIGAIEGPPDEEGTRQPMPLGSIYYAPSSEPRVVRIQGNPETIRARTAEVRMRGADTEGMGQSVIAFGAPVALDPISFARGRYGSAERAGDGFQYVTAQQLKDTAASQGVQFGYVKSGDLAGLPVNEDELQAMLDRNEIREDARHYKFPGGQTGVAIRVNPDGDAIVIPSSNWRDLVKQREALVDRLSYEDRYYTPVGDPVTAVAGSEFATPVDLRRYDKGVRSFRGMENAQDVVTSTGRTVARKNPPGPASTAKDSRQATSDALVLAVRDRNGNWRGGSGRRAADGSWIEGGQTVNPLETVLTRTLDPDSTAAWDRQQEVTLADLVAELNDKYKTPVIGTTGLEARGFRQREGAVTDIPSLLRNLPKGDTYIGDVSWTDRVNSPVFAGLDLPEVEAAKARKEDFATASVPAYALHLGNGVLASDKFRIGRPVKRNTDALLTELSNITNGRFGQTVQLAPNERIAEIQIAADKQRRSSDPTKKRLRVLGDQQVQDMIGRGYVMTPTEVPDLMRFESPGGTVDPLLGATSGYLVPNTIIAAGYKNTGRQIPQKIFVPQDYWDQGFHTNVFSGIGLLSDIPAIRRHVENSSELNPEGWRALELLDAIASYAGGSESTAPRTAGFESYLDPVNRGAFPVTLGAAVPRLAEARTGEGRQSRTALTAMSDATQDLANRARSVTPAIPGLMGQVSYEPWRRRREDRGPSILEAAQTDWLSSSSYDDLQARARYLAAAGGNASAAMDPLIEQGAAMAGASVPTELMPVLAELQRRDAAAAELNPAPTYDEYAQEQARRRVGDWVASLRDGRVRRTGNREFVPYEEQLAKRHRDLGKLGAQLSQQPAVVFRPLDGLFELLPPRQGQPQPASARRQTTPAAALVNDRLAAGGVADEAELLEEMGVLERPRGWSDLEGTGEPGTGGFRVLERPGSDRGDALEPFVQFAQRAGNLPREHARAVAEAAFLSARESDPSKIVIPMRRAATGEDAVKREIYRIVRPQTSVSQDPSSRSGRRPRPLPAERVSRFMASRQPFADDATGWAQPALF